MASASAIQKECWVGWLDYVPVIGTEKNTVEAVVAVAKGDLKEAAEKGAFAISKFLADISTPDEAYVLVTGAIKGVTTKQVSIDAIKKLAKNTATKDVKELADRGIERLDLSTFLQKLERDQSQPKRGHHVINYDVLKIFIKIIDTFIAEARLHKFQELEQYLDVDSNVYMAYKQPMNKEIMTEISTNMVVDINFPYIDANATKYGMVVKMLVKGIAESSLDSTTKSLKEAAIQQTVREMNQYDDYVDQVALFVWENQGKKNKERFNRAQREVVQMLNRLNPEIMGQWVQKLIQANSAVV